MSLLADDDCRVCFHGPHDGLCLDLSMDPGPEGPVLSACICTEYVDLEAESRIVVAVDSPDERPREAGAPQPLPEP